MSKYTIPSKGIVAYSEKDWRMEDLMTTEPEEDEFLVEMIATSICHTDTIGHGGIYPRVLGHEGAGRILKLGSSKLSLQFKEGDMVILSAASCQKCHYCNTKHPAYCVEHGEYTSKANLPKFVLASDHSKVIGGSYFGQSSFASPAPVKASCAVNARDLVQDVAELKKYAPLGCGIMTGAGSITHVGQCGPDDVVAVVGLGGVGLAAVCAAKKRGVKHIVAVDLSPLRIETAREMGATAGLVSSEDALAGKSLQDAIREATPDGLGATHILDATPSVAVLHSCMAALRNNGTILLVGLKAPGAKVEIDPLIHMARGCRLVGVIEGDRDPAEAVPELVGWCKDGTLPIDKLLKDFSIDDYATAIENVEKGQVVKAVLVW